MPDLHLAAAAARATPRDIKRIAIEERWRELIELRKQGVDYWTIADTLGFADAKGAQQALIRALRHFGSLVADDLRLMEAHKLDDMEKTYYTAAIAGDKESAFLWLKIHEARRKLFGLEVQRQEVTHKGGPQNATMVVIGGDGQAYMKSMEEYKKLQAESEPVTIEAEVEESIRDERQAAAFNDIDPMLRPSPKK